MPAGTIHLPYQCIVPTLHPPVIMDITSIKGYNILFVSKGGTSVNWQVTADRMQVNAALTALTEGYDPESAAYVIRAFDGMPADTKYRNEWWVYRRGGTSRTGHTPEHGNVSLHDEEGTVVRSGGPQHPARVGQFKVFRVVRDDLADITFRPFWASDETTTANPTHEWHLHYRHSDLKPAAFVRLDWKLMANPPLWNRLETFWRFFRHGVSAQTRFWTPVPTVFYIAEGFSIT
jgi:hypothetical protein